MFNVIWRKPEEKRLHALIRELRAEREAEAIRQVRKGVEALDELLRRMHANASVLHFHLSHIEHWLERFDVRQVEIESVVHAPDVLHEVCIQLFGTNYCRTFDTLRTLGFLPWEHGWQSHNERANPLDPEPSPTELGRAWIAVIQELKGARVKPPRRYGFLTAWRDQWRSACEAWD